MLTPVTSEMLEKAEKSYRPKSIIELREEIEGEIRVAELHASITGIIDQERVRKIVRMKLDLDGMCADFAVGKLE